VTNGLFEGFTYDQTAADAARLHTGDAAELSFLEEEEEEPAEQEPDAAADGALLGGDGGEL
jgi:hypothetical protein